MVMENPHHARQLLCQLGDHIRDAVIAARRQCSSDFLSAVSHETAADTIYQIDRISEEAILSWFENHWPREWPVELVAEGLEENGPCTFPIGTAQAETRWKCILDPIDGTRGLMHDKRSAWALAALAPQLGSQTKLQHIFVAAMTELPTTKQWRADQVSAVRGSGIVAESVNGFNGSREPLHLQPSRACDFRHGFSSFAKFFPEGKALTARMEEQFWERLHGAERTFAPVVFDDQYISSGGQFYELLAGHDRMVADLRPLIYRAAGIESSLMCHPYDVCTALILEEAGVIFETPAGNQVDVPLDTTTPVAWTGYANATLAELARPVLRKLISELA
jgi:hypothetical protein